MHIMHKRIARYCLKPFLPLVLRRKDPFKKSLCMHNEKEKNHLNERTQRLPVLTTPAALA
jgi:hypothetical protein